MATISELANAAGRRCDALTKGRGAAKDFAILEACVSGLDVGLTLIEQSSGATFSNLSGEALVRSIEYFRIQTRVSVNPQVRDFYQAWADVLLENYRS